VTQEVGTRAREGGNATEWGEGGGGGSVATHLCCALIDLYVTAVGVKLSSDVASAVHQHAPLDTSFIVPCVRLAYLQTTQEVGFFWDVRLWMPGWCK
jgi:hypothetical protein